MNKRKIMLVALSVCMVAILAVGGTLAYFTAEDSVNNVFTYGNVKVKVIEDFEQNAQLLPATGSAQNGTLKNGVTKAVKVNNPGTLDSYVRVHIAIPSVLDNGDPTFDAGKNVLHFNYEDTSIGAGKWDWTKSGIDGKYEGDWNYYTTTIDGKAYNVYVVTWTSVLAAGATTSENAMHQVYLDSKVTQADAAKISESLGNNWEIKVVAEAVQALGFDDAYTALNTAFGVPGTYTPASWAEEASN